MACKGCGKSTLTQWRVFSGGVQVGNVQARSEEAALRAARRHWPGEVTVKAKPAQPAAAGPSTLK